MQTDKLKKCELHVFCAASEVGNGAVAFLRVTCNDTTSVYLTTARSTVVLLKIISLSCLKLCGALLLAKLLSYVKASPANSIIIDYIYRCLV